MAGFWMKGWEVVASACHRFPCESDPFALTLALLQHHYLMPTDFTCHDDNIYCPSPRFLLTVIRTILLHLTAKSVLSLMEAWISYFYSYPGLDATSLDVYDWLSLVGCLRI
jgi:hypothetical protein